MATAQHGVVSRAQLRDAGLTPKAIDHRVEVGRLHAVHRGVYAVGHRRLTRHSRWMAAVLAGGVGAVLSHRSAAALWGIRNAGGPMEVTSYSWHPKRNGIVFRGADLRVEEMTEVDGIPVTTVPRTLLDLAAVVDEVQLERALREAERLQLADTYSVADLVEWHPGKAGLAKLRRVASMAELYRGVTRSELEERFRVFLRDAGLPSPEWNVRLEAAEAMFEVDCVWREQRVVVELDGYGFHAHRHAFERDRLRDRLLQMEGWTPIRITWKALRDDEGLASDLARILAFGKPREE